MRIDIGCNLSDPISREDDIMQGDISTTLFAIYFAIVFRIAFEDYLEGLCIIYRTTRDIPISKDYEPKRKFCILPSLSSSMHEIVTIWHTCRKIFRTVVMYQSASYNMCVEHFITVKGEIVDTVP